MDMRSVDPVYGATLVAFGFEPRGAGPGGPIYVRPVRGPWVIEAVRATHGGGHVDLGLSVEPGRGALVGPVHRAPSVDAVRHALPRAIAALEEAAAAAESLRCPDCHAWEVMQVGPDGPFLACAEVGRGRRPFERSTTACRRSPARPALVLYDERGRPR